jgi:hypothetical protein
MKTGTHLVTMLKARANPEKIIKQTFKETLGTLKAIHSTFSDPVNVNIL